MKIEQSVPKRRHIKFRRQGNTQKKSNPVFLHTYLPMKMEQSVPKCRHTKFRRQGNTHKKSLNKLMVVDFLGTLTLHFVLFYQSMIGAIILSFHYSCDIYAIDINVTLMLLVTT